MYYNIYNITYETYDLRLTTYVARYAVTRYAKDKLTSRLAKDTAKTFQSHAKDKPKTRQQHAKDTPQTRQRHSKDTPQSRIDVVYYAVAP